LLWAAKGIKGREEEIFGLAATNITIAIKPILQGSKY